MDKFLVFPQAQLVKLLFDKIFNRFYIVIGGFFRALDFQCIFVTKVYVQRAQGPYFAGRECRQFRQATFAQGNKIFNFHQYPVLHQGLLGEVLVQRGGGACIPAIYGGYGFEGLNGHAYQVNGKFTKFGAKWLFVKMWAKSKAGPYGRCFNYRLENHFACNGV